MGVCAPGRPVQQAELGEGIDLWSTSVATRQSSCEHGSALAALKVDFVDLCRDSAMSESELSPLRSLLHRLQREVNELRNEVKELRDAIQSIDACAYRNGCPVLDSLRKHAAGDK